MTRHTHTHRSDIELYRWQVVRALFARAFKLYNLLKYNLCSSGFGHSFTFKGTHRPKILIFIDFLFSVDLQLKFIIDFKSAFSFEAPYFLFSKNHFYCNPFQELFLFSGNIKLHF